MTQRHLRNILFGLLVLGYLYYGFQFIQKSVIVTNGQSYYVLFDDAMISMRYAYNLAHGTGLVWNPGEYVEGFTNPLWVGYMALFHLFPIPASQISFCIQLSGLAFLAINLFFVRKIVEEFTGDLFVMLAAVAFTAFYGPLNIWGLLGMEVSILTLILTAALWVTLRSSSRFTPWTYILLAVSTLFRMDMAVAYVIIFGVLFIVQLQYRRQHLIWGLGLLILFLGGQTLARYLYYGDLLPNTYYLKIQGFAISLRVFRGLYALFHLIYYANWAIFLLPLALFLSHRNWKVVLLLLVFLGQIAYSVYVGGDAWEHRVGANRYISLAMPLYFVGLAWTLDEIRRKVLSAWASSNNTLSLLVGSRIIYTALFVCILFSFNALFGEWRSIERWQLARRTIFLQGNEQNLKTALALENTTTPNASIAVVGAGTIPYFLPDRMAIDIMGKTDPIVARGPIRSPAGIPAVYFLQAGNENMMRPGHMKWNYAHTFGELKPDVIVSLWDETLKEFEPYQQEYALASIGDKIQVLLRKDSPNILWDKVVIKE